MEPKQQGRAGIKCRCPGLERAGRNRLPAQATRIVSRTKNQRLRGLTGPWICSAPGEGQAGCRVPAQDVQDVDQARRHMVQHHARAPSGMITARGGGEDDEGPQAGDVAVLHVREVDVNLAGIPGNAGERPNQALVAVLVSSHPRRTARACFRDG